MSQLVAVVKQLKEENKKLLKKNADLEKKHEKLELSLLDKKQSIDQEKALTKAVVDDLIKSIDSLVGEELV